MSNRTDIVVETDNAEGQVLLSASRVYDLTEDKTQDTINSEVGSSLTSLGNTLNQLAIQSPVVTSSNFTNPISCPGLTANHVVCNWGLFSDSACTTPLDPNNPPADITIVEGAGQYNLTIQNSIGTFYLKPTFILP